MKISASIVLYKTPEQQLNNLLDSIKKSSVEIQCHFVDNSPDNSLQRLCSLNNSTYTHQPSNPGFGISHNKIILGNIDSAIHFIINPDVSFGSDCIENIVLTLTKKSSCVAVTPKILYPDGNIQRLCKLIPSPSNLILRRFFPPLARLTDKKYELHNFDYCSEIEIPYASGCFLAVRTDVLRKIGGFDENFFMYLEDTDLSRRLLDHGKILFAPNAIAQHEFGKASYKNKNLLFAHIKSAIYYFNKWGWFFDQNRRSINKKTLKQVQDIKAKNHD